jgi:RecA-family ATPase
MAKVEGVVMAREADMPDEGFFGNAANDGAATASAEWDTLVTPVTSEWFERKPPTRLWLLRDGRRKGMDGVLPLGKVGQFIAAGGVGKTMALIQLALAVASGSKWLDTFPVPPEGKGRVLLALGEEDLEEAQRRAYNAHDSRGHARPADGEIVLLPLAGVPCAMLERGELGNSRETAFLVWLRDYLVREVKRTGQPWRLIVIDPLSRFAGPDAETDNAAGTRFVQALESIARLTGAVVLFSHHTNKLVRHDGAEVTGAGGRGSSSIFDGCRWEASLGVERVALEDPETRERLGELVTLAFTKSNYSLRGESLALRRAAGGPLVPLDEIDRETVTAAKGGGAARARKSEEKAAEREARARKEEERLAQQRATQAAKKSAELEAKWHEREDALVQILWNHPDGIGSVDLRAALIASLGSLPHGHDAATVGRLGDGVRIEPGPKNGKRHFLQPDRVPEAVKARLSWLGGQEAR